MPPSSLAIFSDLDGCLLNKTDYSFEPARGVLARIRQENIPLVLASSKTEAEMVRLSQEMELADAPLICENGGAILWPSNPTPGSPLRAKPIPIEEPATEQLKSVEVMPPAQPIAARSPSGDPAARRLVLGVPRSKVLEILAGLKRDFHFSSFADLQLEGVMQNTGLAADRAEAALLRHSTEPLLWQDEEEKIHDFRRALEAASLTLTRGGRFWHVAGPVDKGQAMQRVMQQFANSENAPSLVTIAIGDSPIDQSMLDLADYPIGVPTPEGLVQVDVSRHNGRIAPAAGARGWAIAVNQVLEELHNGNHG